MMPTITLLYLGLHIIILFSHGRVVSAAIPNSCTTAKLNVSVDLKIIALTDLNVKTQTTKMLLGLTLKWRDPIWTKAAPRNQTIYVSGDEVCSPRLFFNESVVKQSLVAPDTEVLVTTDHHVILYTPIKYRGLCISQTQSYPHDTTQCTLTLRSNVRQSAALDMYPEGGALLPDTGLNIANSEWDILRDKLAVERLDTYGVGEAFREAKSVALQYSIQFQRNGHYYVMNLVTPCFMATMVTLVAVFTTGYGASIQNREQIGITALLYCAVQLLSVSKEMPVTSDVPNMNAYFIATICLIALSTVIHSCIVQMVRRHLAEHKTNENSNKRVVQSKIASSSAAMKEESEANHTPPEAPGTRVWPITKALNRMCAFVFHYHPHINAILLFVATTAACVNLMCFFDYPKYKQM